MKTITIGTRIYCLAGLLTSVIAGLSVFVIVTLQQIRERSDAVANGALPGVAHTAVANAAQIEAQLWIARYLRTETAEQREKIKREFDRIGQRVTAELAAFEKVIESPEEKALFAQFSAARKEYFNARVEFMQLMEKDRAVAEAFVDTKMKAAYEGYLGLGNQLFEMNKVSGATEAAGLDAKVANARTVFLITSGVAAALAALLSVWLVRQIDVALGLVVHTVAGGAEQITSAASQVSSGSQSLAEGASEQAASLEETSASLEEISSMTQRNADSARQASAAAGHTREAADRGATRMQAMQSAMGEIQSASTEIAKILKTIDEIAFQTNILALNAAVEAARAGEAGAGFAVVAEEVRALAQRCANAAQETAAKIEDSVNKSRQGVGISAEVAGGFGEIQTQIQQLEKLVNEIATASNEQSQGIRQVATAVSQMDKVTQSNAGNAEETAAASEEMNAQAMNLMDAVGQLRALSGTEVSHTPAAATERTQRGSSPVPASGGLRVPSLPRGSKAKDALVAA